MSHAPVRLQPPPPASPGESAVYLRAITEDILGWSDPGKRLREALAGDDFLLFAQRIRPLKSGIESGCCEILLRLREEEGNPPVNKYQPEVEFSRNLPRGGSLEEIAFYRQPDPGRSQAG